MHFPIILFIIGAACWFAFKDALTAMLFVLAGITVGALAGFMSGQPLLFLIPFAHSVVAALPALKQDRAHKDLQTSWARFKIARQVFFHESGEPLKNLHDGRCQTDLEKDIFVLEYGRHPPGASYPGLLLLSDAICLKLDGGIEKADVENAFGRMAIPGVAAGLIDNALGAKAVIAGISAVVRNFPFRGASKRSDYQGSLSFADGTVLTFRLSQTDVGKLYNAIPKIATSEDAVSRTFDRFQHYDDMAAEAELGVKETVETLQELNRKRNALEQHLEVASTVAERKNIRADIAETEDRIAFHRNCFRYIAHRSGTNLRDLAARHADVVQGEIRYGHISGSGTLSE